MGHYEPSSDATTKVVARTRKIERFFSLAKNVAQSSEYGKIKHGALLAKGGSVLNVSCNKDNYTSFGTRFRCRHRGHATVHAELGCILGMPRNVTTGADVYVCRVNKQGEFRNSRPCAMCHAALKHVGIKRVYYTTDNNNIEMYKL